MDTSLLKKSLHKQNFVLLNVIYYIRYSMQESKQTGNLGKARCHIQGLWLVDCHQFWALIGWFFFTSFNPDGDLGILQVKELLMSIIAQIYRYKKLSGFNMFIHEQGKKFSQHCQWICQFHHKSVVIFISFETYDLLF